MTTQHATAQRNSKASGASRVFDLKFDLLRIKYRTELSNIRRDRSPINKGKVVRDTFLELN